jgi:hypothetical protein
MNRTTLLMAAGVLASTAVGLVAGHAAGASDPLRCIVREDVQTRYDEAVRRYDRTDSNDPRHQRAFLEAHRLDQQLRRIDQSRPVSEECPR